MVLTYSLVTGQPRAAGYLSQLHICGWNDICSAVLDFQRRKTTESFRIRAFFCGGVNKLLALLFYLSSRGRS